MPANTRPTSSTTSALAVDLRTVTDYSSGSTATNVVRQVMNLGDPATAANVANVVYGPPNGNEGGLCVYLMPHQSDLEDIKALLIDIRDELRKHTLALGVSPAQDPITPI